MISKKKDDKEEERKGVSKDREKRIKQRKRVDDKTSMKNRNVKMKKRKDNKQGERIMKIWKS